jgi:hypothetical protein
MKDFEKFLQKDTTFFTKSLKDDHPLSNLYERALDAYTVSSKDMNTPNILWGKERYHLEKSSFFTKLDIEIQSKILRRITELNLSLSAYIEKSGHNYGAKMILLSESMQEKSLYALFTAEEAIHLKEFSNFMNFEPDPKLHWHPMLNPLADAIKDGEKNTCTYIIQVLLEGFGMSHYKGLKEDCLYSPLKKAYERILIDEAKHHGTGLILSKEANISKIEKEQIFEYSRAFILSLQSADWILNTTEQFSGGLSSDQIKKFKEETFYEKTLTARLVKLKDMIKKVDHCDLVSSLEREKVFTPKAS